MGVGVGVATAAARIAHAAGPKSMRRLARMNRSLTNPMMQHVAGRAAGMALIEHAGRRSGAVYQTPVMCFVSDAAVAVVLNYGTESDWVRNLLATQDGWMTHRGRRLRLSQVRVVPIGDTGLRIRVRDGDRRYVLLAVVT